MRSTKYPPSIPIIRRWLLLLLLRWIIMIGPSIIRRWRTVVGRTAALGRWTIGWWPVWMMGGVLHFVFWGYINIILCVVECSFCAAADLLGTAVAPSCVKSLCVDSQDVHSLFTEMPSRAQLSRRSNRYNLWIVMLSILCIDAVVSYFCSAAMVNVVDLLSCFSLHWLFWLDCHIYLSHLA